MNGKLLLLLGLTFSLSSCEKDDICAESTPTTPKVVIEFYDAANPTTAKNVSNLVVTSPDFTNKVNHFIISSLGKKKQAILKVFTFRLPVSLIFSKIQIFFSTTNRQR